MDLRGLKKTACGLGWAVDRVTRQVCGWTLGDRGTETARRLAAPLPHAAHSTFRTDFWHPCGLIFARHRHLQGKAHTFTPGSHNNRRRIDLARLRRKTHCDTRKPAHLAASILFHLPNKSQSIPSEQSPQFNTPRFGTENRWQSVNAAQTYSPAVNFNAATRVDTLTDLELSGSTIADGVTVNKDGPG